MVVLLVVVVAAVVLLFLMCDGCCCAFLCNEKQYHFWSETKAHLVERSPAIVSTSAYC